MGGQQPYEGLSQVASETYGPGYFAPANEDQAKDLVLFDKKKPPRDERNRPIFGVVAYEDRPVCGSKKRGKAAFCSHEGRMQNGRCRYHGGRSPGGTLSPHYKTGKHSKFAIPSNLVARYQNYVSDPEINEHRSSIAQINLLVNELWEKYEDTLDPELMKKIAKEYRRCANARAARNRIKAAEHFEELG